jgi:hypothetical protein
MNRRISWKLAFAALAAALLLAPAAVVADETAYIVTSYITKVDIKPVGDVEGHVAGSWERRGLCIFPKNEVAAYHGAGTLDGTKGKGTVKGESSCTFEDGSSTTIAWTASFAPGAKGLPTFKDGKGEYVRGTGRFTGIEGTIAFSGRTYTPTKEETKGDVVMETVAKYTIPKS